MQFSNAMLVSLGRRHAPEGLVELLQECHLRIRSFLRAADRLSTADRSGPDAAAAVAADIHRYFCSAFPLHLADEDESLAPRLCGASPEVDSALATMSADHEAHIADVRRLVQVCGDIQAGEWSPRVAARLAAVMSVLAGDLGAHLELEERVIFPAIATLQTEVQAEILAEMRARREHVRR